MRTNRVEGTLSTTTPGGSPEAAGGTVAAPPPPPAPAAPADRVSLEQVAQVRTSVATGVTMAASERSERIAHLAQAVRAGTYRPNASQLAAQMLADAEMEAQLARALS